MSLAEQGARVAQCGAGVPEQWEKKGLPAPLGSCPESL